MNGRTLLLLALLAAVLAYAAGLSGPFLLDDGNNLASARSWIEGHSSLYEAIWGTRSGLLHRPVAMASFALDAFLAGIRPMHFKLTNLLLHLIAGLLIWQLIRRILSAAGESTQSADTLAAVVSLAWLLHPLNLSTVLYVVQRMTQLSTLFVIGALLAYLAGRQALANGQPRRAALLWGLAFPALILLGALSKENALVAPALCLLIEASFFRKAPLPFKWIASFFSMFLFLPAFAGLLALSIHPEIILGGYSQRDFTMLERLLTQSRVLMDYLGQILWPRVGGMGLYHDDVTVSESILRPSSTLLALAALIGLSVTAAGLYRRAPLITAGWFFFLVAHAVESTILPLEMYFEHRNYLPSIGILVAVIGILIALRPRLMRLGVLAPAAGWAALLTVAVLLAGSTTIKAMVWRDAEHIAREGVRHHPLSLRAHLDLATVALSANRLAESFDALYALTKHPVRSNQLVGHLGIATLDCLQHKELVPTTLKSAEPRMGTRISLIEVQAYALLWQAATDRQCVGAGPEVLAPLFGAALDQAVDQPDSDEPKWRLRLLASGAWQRAGDEAESLRQVQLAWQPTSDYSVASMLIQAQLRAGDVDGAESTWSELAGRVGRNDSQGHHLLGKTRVLIDAARGGTQGA